ncbi:SDR family oxidoreductase [Terriglobus sp. 2YAB30_2]|uniref:SDR family oxidoreductase n=1 Tax=unclassified Terriglobus TaxID=2628988 RepID=UPI003F975D2A
MRVFVTGATGFIGSAIVQELVHAGHRVLALTRSAAGAKSLAVAGAEIHMGDLEDQERLRLGASMCDGVIHTAFVHDFTNWTTSCEIDRRAIEALGSGLAGSNRPLIAASGTGVARIAGQLATEEDPQSISAGIPRTASEEAVQTVAALGVQASVVRLPPIVHGEGDNGFIPEMIATARQRGVSAYVVDGHNRWPAVHRLDAAHLFRLALESGTAGTTYNGVADQAVPIREIAEAIGRRLRLPIVSKSADQAVEHFGFLGHLLSLDIPASSTVTQKLLGWYPRQSGLISDLDHVRYFEA